MVLTGEVVTLTIASGNQLEQWLKCVDLLRRAA
jgi:hypothetical protein